MTQYSPEQLKQILDAHAQWRRGEDGGKRADLRGAYLGGADLGRANLSGADLSGADLSDAGLSRANLSGAYLRDAYLSPATIIDTGETWQQYLDEVVPALLTAGGKTVQQIVAAGAWKCHQWTNCPMAEAFGIHDDAEGPILLRPRIRQFVHFFDAQLIPEPGAAPKGDAKGAA